MEDRSLDWSTGKVTNATKYPLSITNGVARSPPEDGLTILCVIEFDFPSSAHTKKTQVPH